MSTNLPDVQILHSWKEISSYTGRGVRTLQRYETRLGFPIHRPLGKPRSSVLALRHEIDAWMAKTPVASAKDSPESQATHAEMPVRNVNASWAALSSTTAQWSRQTSSMQQRFASMQQAVSSMQEKLNVVVHGLERMQTSTMRSRLLWEQVQMHRERLRTLGQSRAHAKEARWGAAASYGESLSVSLRCSRS